MSRNNGITFEPCTLVYTLLDDNTISFEDFELIVRSLHSYMVDSITPNKPMRNVHVKLNYQASTINAQNKLGILQSCVAVTKLSNFVQESEFSKLEQFKRQFNIGGSQDDFPSPSPQRQQRRRGSGRAQFAPRPAPYRRQPAAATLTRSETPPDTEECTAAGYPYPCSTEKRRNPAVYFGDIEENQQSIGE